MMSADPILCGEGATDPTPDGPKPFGCGLPIDGGQRVYRCADCDLAFHKACLRMHFRGPTESSRPSCSETDRLRDVIRRIETVILAADVDLATTEIEALRAVAEEARSLIGWDEEHGLVAAWNTDGKRALARLHDALGRLPRPTHTTEPTR
jgi:hypothetical protein